MRAARRAAAAAAAGLLAISAATPARAALNIHRDVGNGLIAVLRSSVGFPALNCKPAAGLEDGSGAPAAGAAAGAAAAPAAVTAAAILRNCPLIPREAANSVPSSIDALHRGGGPVAAAAAAAAPRLTRRVGPADVVDLPAGFAGGGGGGGSPRGDLTAEELIFVLEEAEAEAEAAAASSGGGAASSSSAGGGAAGGFAAAASAAAAKPYTLPPVLSNLLSSKISAAFPAKTGHPPSRPPRFTADLPITPRSAVIRKSASSRTPTILETALDDGGELLYSSHSTSLALGDALSWLLAEDDADATGRGGVLSDLWTAAPAAPLPPIVPGIPGPAAGAAYSAALYSSDVRAMERALDEEDFAEEEDFAAFPDSGATTSQEPSPFVLEAADEGEAGGWAGEAGGGASGGEGAGGGDSGGFYGDDAGFNRPPPRDDGYWDWLEPPADAPFPGVPAKTAPEAAAAVWGVGGGRRGDGEAPTASPSSSGPASEPSSPSGSDEFFMWVRYPHECDFGGLDLMHASSEGGGLPALDEYFCSQFHSLGGGVELRWVGDWRFARGGRCAALPEAPSRGHIIFSRPVTLTRMQLEGAAGGAVVVQGWKWRAPPAAEAGAATDAGSRGDAAAAAAVAGAAVADVASHARIDRLLRAGARQGVWTVQLAASEHAGPVDLVDSDFHVALARVSGLTFYNLGGAAAGGGKAASGGGGGKAVIGGGGGAGAPAPPRVDPLPPAAEAGGAAAAAAPPGTSAATAGSAGEAGAAAGAGAGGRSVAAEGKRAEGAAGRGGAADAAGAGGAFCISDFSFVEAVPVRRLTGEVVSDPEELARVLDDTGKVPFVLLTATKPKSRVKPARPLAAETAAAETAAAETAAAQPAPLVSLPLPASPPPPPASPSPPPAAGRASESATALPAPSDALPTLHTDGGAADGGVISTEFAGSAANVPAAATAKTAARPAEPAALPLSSLQMRRPAPPPALPAAPAPPAVSAPPTLPSFSGRWAAVRGDFCVRQQPPGSGPPPSAMEGILGAGAGGDLGEPLVSGDGVPLAGDTRVVLGPGGGVGPSGAGGGAGGAAATAGATGGAENTAATGATGSAGATGAGSAEDQLFEVTKMHIPVEAPVLSLFDAHLRDLVFAWQLTDRTTAAAVTVAEARRGAAPAPAAPAAAADRGAAAAIDALTEQLAATLRSFLLLPPPPPALPVPAGRLGPRTPDELAGPPVAPAPLPDLLAGFGLAAADAQPPLPPAGAAPAAAAAAVILATLADDAGAPVVHRFELPDLMRGLPDLLLAAPGQERD